MVDAFFAFSEIPKPDLGPNDGDCRLLYFPYIPSKNRVNEVRARLITTSVRSWISGSCTPRAEMFENGSVWRVVK